MLFVRIASAHGIDGWLRGSVEQPGLVSRPRIVGLLNTAWQIPLTLVCAESGYGKTTALGALRADPRTRYLRLTARHRDAATLAAELRVDAGGAERMLVLDDLECLRGATAAVHALSRFVDDMDATTHVVLCGRWLPPVQPAARMRSAPLQVSAADLAFDLGETAAVLGPEVGHSQECQRLTAGWPAAVGLASRMLRRLETPGDTPLDERGEEELVSSWRHLAARVVADQEHPVTLGVLAVVGEIDAKLVAELGLDVGADELTDLRRRGLLVGGGGAALRVAPALIHAARDVLDADQARSARLVAVHWWERSGRLDVALDCLVDGGDDELESFLVRCGHQLVVSGAADRITKLALRWPRPRPELETVVADAWWQLGHWVRATAAFERVLHAYGDTGLPAAFAWRFGALLYLSGERGRSEAVLSAARPESSDADQALVAAWLASALWLADRTDDADECTRRALRLAWGCHDKRALAAAEVAHALVCAARGDRAGNTLAYRVAMDAASTAGDAMQLARIHANLASKALEEGDYDAAVRSADRGVQAAGPHTAIAGLALENKAAALMRQGKLDVARAAAADAADAYATRGSAASALAAAVPQLLLGEIYRLRDDQVQARLAFERALLAGESAEDTQTVVQASAGLAWMLARENPAAAQAYADRALKVASALSRADALNAAAWVALVTGESAVAGARSAEAEVEAQRNNERAALATALELRCAADPSHDIGLLQAALAVWVEIGNPVAAARCRLALASLEHDDTAATAARRALADLALAPDVGITAVLCAVSRRSGDPSIVTLGRFAVTVDGATIPATAWQSRKARDLLKLLTTRAGRRITREALADALWPDEPYAAAGPRLSVLLSRLRAVLDPERRHPPDHYLDADKVSVALRVDRMTIDVFEFLAAVDEATNLASTNRWGAAERELRRAEQLYAGDFLDDDRDCDWAVELREHARARASECARLLARSAAHRRDDEQAARWLQRLLERDPYDEDAWTALIAADVRLRRHGEARHQYASYVRRMDELDVAVEPFDRLVDRLP